MSATPLPPPDDGRRSEDRMKGIMAALAMPVMLTALGTLAAFEMRTVLFTLEQVRTAQETDRVDFTNRLARIEQGTLSTTAGMAELQRQLSVMESDDKELDRRVTRLETLNHIATPDH